VGLPAMLADVDDQDMLRPADNIPLAPQPPGTG